MNADWGFGFSSEMSRRRRPGREDDEGRLVDSSPERGWSLADLGEGHGHGNDMSVESQQWSNYYTDTAMGERQRKRW